MRRLALLALAGLLTIGCASAKLTVIRPLEAPVRRVSLSIDPSATGGMTAEQQSRLRTTLTTSLVDSGVSIIPTGEPGTSSLLGVPERFQPGNRALRYLIGFGAGRGLFESTWLVEDSAGAEVGECRVDGSITMGVFGGSYDDVLEKVGDRLADFLLKRR